MPSSGRAHVLSALAAFAILAGSARGQENAGVYGRADVAGLRSASEKAPDSAGLLLRLSLAVLANPDLRPSQAKPQVQEIHGHFRRVLEINPSARGALHALARDAYFSNRYEESVTLGRKLLALDPTDTVVATEVVKSLLKLGREQEAVDAMLEWFRSGNTPGVGATQGLLSVFVSNPKVRQGLDDGLKRLVAANPRHVVLPLSYAGYLLEVGRAEDAWAHFHAAEKNGLCDASSGGRHPFATSLARKAPEPASPGATGSSDLAVLRQQVEAVPDHVGLRIRLGRRIELPITSRESQTPLDDDEKKRLSEAASAYMKAFDLNPDCRPPIFRAAELYILLERLDEAVATLDKATGLFPEFLPGWLSLAEARARMQDSGAAAQAFVRYACAVEPGNRTDAFFKGLGLTTKAALEPFAAALEAEAAKQKHNLTLLAHLLSVRLRQDDRTAAQRAAVEAERQGLVGIQGWPHPLVMDAFGIKRPDTRADSKPSR